MVIRQDEQGLLRGSRMVQIWGNASPLIYQGNTFFLDQAKL